MMDDIYLEYMLKRKKSGAQLALITLIIVLGVVLSLVLFALVYIISVAFQQAGTPLGQIATCLGLLIIGFMWYGAYLLISMQNIEYEYILTNSEIDMDKIMSKKGRKHLVSFDFKEVTVCANIRDDEHNHDYKNTPADKTYDITSDKSGDNIYFADFSDEGKRIRVLFQPTSKMINSAKRFNPRNIFVMEE